MKMDRVFSDAVCAEVDKGLAQYVRWYESRAEEQRKVGKHKYKRKYDTLDELLGVTEAQRRGPYGMDGAKLTEVSGDYKRACIEAAKAGLPMPDITQWLAKRHADEDEFME